LKSQSRKSVDTSTPKRRLIPAPYRREIAPSAHGGATRPRAQ